MAVHKSHKTRDLRHQKSTQLHVWCSSVGGTVFVALNLRLEVADSTPAAAMSSATLDKLFTHISLFHQAV